MKKKKGWKNEMKTIKKCNRNREEISKYKRVKNSKTKGKNVKVIGNQRQLSDTKAKNIETQKFSFIS